jgi:hypothetical protein
MLNDLAVAEAQAPWEKIMTQTEQITAETVELVPLHQ